MPRAEQEGALAKPGQGSAAECGAADPVARALRADEIRADLTEEQREAHFHFGINLVQRVSDGERERESEIISTDILDLDTTLLVSYRLKGTHQQAQ